MRDREGLSRFLRILLGSSEMISGSLYGFTEFKFEILPDSSTRNPGGSCGSLKDYRDQIRDFFFLLQGFSGSGWMKMPHPILKRCFQILQDRIIG